MAFRWLIYRTDVTYLGTIIRESSTNDSGVDEAGLFTDFVIPEIQPLYLWRVTGGTSVVPNIDSNISAWEENIAPPPQPDDNATLGQVTGLTEQKIDKVTGATGNLGIFTVDGNLEDGGYSLAQLTGATSGGTPLFLFESYTADTETRLVGIELDIVSLSAVTDSQQIQIDNLSGVTDSLQSQINYISGVTDTITGQTAGLQSQIDFISGVTDSQQSQIDFISGVTDSQQSQINYISGVTDTKLDISDFNNYTGNTQPIIDSAITGVTNLGSGTTLGSTSGRNITLKSVSGIGGISISGDSDNLIISGETSTDAVWGNITGTLSNQTDLQNALDAKLDEGLFNSYTGVTDTRLGNIELDITSLSGETTSLQSQINFISGVTDSQQSQIDFISGVTDTKLNISDFNSYSAATDTRIDDLEADSVIFYQDRLINITGATNGLSKIGGKDVKLGGALTENTTISGSSFDLSFDIQNLTILSSGQTNITDGGGNNININSNIGLINLVGNDISGVEQTKIAISETSMVITDSRTTKTGIEYAADYAASFVARSLVDKGYVDAVAAGLDLKESVKAATYTGDTDIDLGGGTFGGTIDGYTVQDGDRVLIKNQDSNKEQNGIYVYSSGGNNFARAIDFVDPYVTSGAFMFVETGNTNASSGWVLVTQDPITVGTTPLTFTQFSDAGQLQAGIGINISGNVINVDGASLAGNSIVWTGNTFNVDVTSGTLAAELNTKLNITDFNSYTGVTETRLQGIESNITFISGITDTKLDTEIFTGYTASTVSNELFLIHTGGTELNNVTATAIDWNTVVVSGSSFLWTGGTDIFIQETADYELNYNIPYNAAGAQNISPGGNIILNNSTVLDVTASAAFTTVNNAAANLALPTVILSLTDGDKLTLASFRTGSVGSAISSQTGSILIKKKNTLQ